MIMKIATVLELWAQVTGGLFAASFATLNEVPLVCELSDEDNDGLFDDEDRCPRSNPKLEVNECGVWQGRA